MRLPRRVPWASLSQLDLLCSWIYADDAGSKLLAIHRLSAWRATSHLPHALDSTLALLVAITLDSPSTPQAQHLSIRQNYAAAIIRLVNGFVDPLQLGAYARSIASIANQIGLPQWLVELRHAATHEELPSLELLREAARESMTWLLHNYFLPTLNPTSTTCLQPSQFRPLTPLLKKYKSLLKMTIRDASLVPVYKSTTTSLVKDIDRWVSEAKVAANVAAGDFVWEAGRFSDSTNFDDQDKERWALEKLCDGLLEKGALIPLSKKKRTYPINAFSPPTISVQIWSPLLHHLCDLHPDLPSVLCGRIVSCLSACHAEDGAEKPDLSFTACLARWAMWSVETWGSDTRGAELDLRREVIINLMQALGHGLMDGSKDKAAAKDLLQRLCDSTPEWQVPLAWLLQSPNTSTQTWNANHIDVMNQRLELVQTFNSQTDNVISDNEISNTDHDDISSDASGWKLLNDAIWRPCPIGVHFAPTK
ncbi:hypothetical protein AX17_000570 [Amanita inopinata Kibby_2008]|nr:hypothetical protein AX17_000570 [Amanita inopinata Kibby_2008]